PKVSDEKPRFLTPNELRATLEAAPEWMRAPIALAAATGMRRGELLALRWLDIDFGLKLIFLRSATTKTAEPRAIPLTPAAQLVLESLSHGKPGAHVFADVDPARLSVYIRRVFASLGIENASFHTLRHTAASWMVQAGVSLYSTGQVLGHKTPRMTQRYAHLAPEHLATAAGKLSDALMKALPGTAQTVSDEEPQ
ncbi:MAG: site-specific integrase, partial [Terracidiphilus sp.]